MTEIQDSCFAFSLNQNKEAILHRVYGDAPQVGVPDEINGAPVREIGAYGFSDRKKYPEYAVLSQMVPEHFRELSGSYITEVHLPGTVRKIGNYAFYNCTALKELHLGCRMNSLGSDAFMNCRSLKRIVFHCSPAQQTGLRILLAQLNTSVEVVFWGRDGIEAEFLFPEFNDAYDEVAAAHIFRRKISGEGFRARQCFRENVLDISAYDEIFVQACVEESESTLRKMAVSRLAHPYGLKEKHRKQYEDYIHEHERSVVTAMVRRRQLKQLEALWKLKLLSQAGIAAGIQACTETEWAEGAVSFLNWNSLMKSGKKEDRYSFDSF